MLKVNAKDLEVGKSYTHYDKFKGTKEDMGKLLDLGNLNKDGHSNLDNFSVFLQFEKIGRTFAWDDKFVKTPSGGNRKSKKSRKSKSRKSRRKSRKSRRKSNRRR